MYTVLSVSCLFENISVLHIYRSEKDEETELAINNDSYRQKIIKLKSKHQSVSFCDNDEMKRNGMLLRLE